MLLIDQKTSAVSEESSPRTARKGDFHGDDDDGNDEDDDDHDDDQDHDDVPRDDSRTSLEGQAS